jgi:sugar lactone lactonase YvrE
VRTFIFRLVAVLVAVFLLAPADTRADILYVADSSGGNVFQLNTAAGNGQVGQANPIATPTNGITFNTPTGLALDTSGNLYVSDSGTSPNLVFKLTRGAQGSGFINFGAFTQSNYANGTNISGPQGIAFDSAGFLYVANQGNNQVTKVPPGGDTTNGGSLFAAQSAAFTLARSPTNGFIYVTAAAVSGAAAQTINVFRTDGSSVGSFAVTTPTGLFGSYSANGIAFDQAGNLYISELQSGQASIVAKQAIGANGLSNGASTNYATGPGPGLTFPTGLVFDQAGNLYIADGATGVVDRVVPGGGSYAVFASGFGAPRFLAVFATPEPSSLALLSMAASAMGGYGWWGWRRRRLGGATEAPAVETETAPEENAIV